MIIKSREPSIQSGNPRLDAGAKVEHDVAFFLHRDFAQDEEVLILHDLRLEDAQLPESDGRAGVCQIDHLILHRWGAFIVESKSFVTPVTVEADSAGGDVWTRTYAGRKVGFASPIQQARRQSDFLRAVLQRERSRLRGEGTTVGNALRLLLNKPSGPGFLTMPIQLIIAYGVDGSLTARGRWKPPMKPFRTFVSKADLVPAVVRQELQRHRAAASLLGSEDGQYGIWSESLQVMGAVAAFLASRHCPASRAASLPSPSPPPPPPPPPPSPPPLLPAYRCKTCRSVALQPILGRFGPYWKCTACGGNTSLPAVCARCGSARSQGGPVDVKLKGPGFVRSCGACGHVETVQTDASERA